LRRFSGRGATDDQDKVYALLGLTRDRLDIEPNYSLDILTVFHNTALAIMKTGSLSIIVGDIGRKNRQDLPLWVPDWSAAYDDLNQRWVKNTEQYNAALGIPIQPMGEIDQRIAISLEDLRFEYNRGKYNIFSFGFFQRRLECQDMLLVLVAPNRALMNKEKPEDNLKRYYTRHKILLQSWGNRCLVSGLFID